MGESLYETPKGLVLSPGGGDFYAAIWTNDCVEYVGPWFGVAGDPEGADAMFTALRLFAAAMPGDGSRMPGSIANLVSGGMNEHPGGDRGDAAMYLSGATRFLLLRGDTEAARELWPAVCWAAEYCLRKTTSAGVVASDSDELEGRFPTGSANLSTSCIAYDGYRHAAMLARDLGHGDWETRLEKAAADLVGSIDAFFGATVAGHDTYRYFDGCTQLRGWQGLPMAVGLYRRAAATTRALLSERMLTEEGIRTQEGDPTVWDRCTFTALGGMLRAGQVDAALPALVRLARRRLLGDHVPYAWEFNVGQLHLAAESALFNRAILEGLFGLSVVGLGRAEIRPRLPDGWSDMALQGLSIGGIGHDIEVRRSGDGMETTHIVADNGAPRVACTEFLHDRS
jgi:hypothetical protein